MSKDTLSTSISSIKKSDNYKNSIDKNCSGIEVEGFLFIPNSIDYDVSYNNREYKRTSIMGGGEFVSRTTYNPREFSFSTTLEISPSEPYEYDAVFEMMMNKKGGCEVITPFLKDKINGEVEITKKYEESSPHSMEVEVKIKEIGDPDTSLYGDDEITYPSITKLSDKAVTISNKTEASEETTSDKETTDEWKKKLLVDYDNPYNTEGYTNSF